MSYAVDAVKLENKKVFKVKHGEIEIYFREPTVGEKIALDRSEKLPGSVFIIIRQLIVDFSGISDIDEIQKSPLITKAIMDTLYSKAPLLSAEATIALFSEIETSIHDNLIFRFKSWVARELNYPDFMYLSDAMSASEFMRYIVMAEEIAGLPGMFLYALTGDESKLSDTAKQTLQNAEQAKVEAQGPDWMRAGLKRPPNSITERKMVQNYLREEAARLEASGIGPIIEKDDVPDRYSPQQAQDPTAIRNMAIQRAGHLLAQKIKHEEMLKARGQQVPRFSFEQDQQLQQTSENEI